MIDLETVRDAITSAGYGPYSEPQKALDRLVAEKERAERERDEARGESAERHRKHMWMCGCYDDAVAKWEGVLSQNDALSASLRSVCEALETAHEILHKLTGIVSPHEGAHSEICSAMAAIRAVLDAAKKEMGQT